MLKVKLPKSAESLRKDIMELCLYNNKLDLVVEVAEEQTIKDSVWIDTKSCKTFHDVLIQLSQHLHNRDITYSRETTGYEVDTNPILEKALDPIHVTLRMRDFL